MTDRRPGGGRPDLDRVPDAADAPLAWDASRRRFAAGAQAGGADGRRIVVPAPPHGGHAAPPPRRRPEVVLPRPADVAPAPRSAPGGPGGASRPAARSAPGGPGGPGGASGSGARSAAGGPAGRRVVVPAPDARRAAPTSPASRRTRPADPPDARRARRFPPSRRTVARIALALVVVVALLGAGGLLWGYSQFQSIERVELADLLASADGTNYLIVGSDTRDGISVDDPNASAILGPDAPAGERSDTMLLLRVDGEGSRMLSIPRDLLVTIAETGEVSRINSAFNGGPRRLVATVQDQLQLPIHHYVEIDFVAFRDLVDALGGITIDFPHPASDHMSGLNVTQSGPVRLDGTQALAYVRSRYYTEWIDGEQVTDPTGDIGRIARQQQFLSAVIAEVGSVRNPLRLADMTTSMVDGMRIDDSMGYLDALRLALRLRSMELEPTSLPTENRRTRSGMAVLDLVQPGADEVLSRFGSPGAAIG